jgi:hypothetical protein
MGLSLETASLPWGDWWALVSASPPGSAMYRAVNQEYGLTEHLLCTMLDRLNTQIWMKTKDAHADPPRNRPERVPRPGVEKRPDVPYNGMGLPPNVVSIEEFIRRQAEERERNG